MIVNNKLDNTFGPFGSVMGYIILLFGIYVCFYSWIGVTTILVGAFLAFSYTSTKIDFKDKRVKYSSNLFGFFSIGYWIDIKPEMRLFVKDFNKKDDIFKNTKNIQSPLKNNFRIILTDENGKEIIAVKKTYDKLLAEKEMAEITWKLELNIAEDSVIS